MNVVYTYCTLDGGKEINGFMKQMACLSFMSAKKHIKDAHTILYCDKVSYEHFKNSRALDEIHVVDFDKYNFDHRFWCFPKFVTYSLQNEKFIHVDIDMTFIKDVDLPDTDIICERFRDIEKTPDELHHADKKLPIPDKICCSGIFGGTNVGVFKKFFMHAKEVCSTHSLKHSDVLYEHLYSLEEVYTTQQFNAQGLSIYEIPNDAYVHFWRRPKEENYSELVSSLLCQYSFL